MTFSPRLAACCAILVISCFVHAVVGQTTAPNAQKNPRVVRAFDFDERKLGNFESLPMNWLRVDAPGFPRFLEPAFDLSVGHHAPPSFAMSIRTGNVGAFYRAKDIVADADSEYRISGWVKTDGLQYAGAVITAFYYDHNFVKIDASEQRSPMLRSQDAWTRIHIDLPGGNPHARWIGLSCRIEQPLHEISSTADIVPIPYTDVTGSAWFDDIIIMRRPRVRLQLDRPDHVYRQNEDIDCHVQLFDVDGVDLDIALELRDADDQLVARDSLVGRSLIHGGRTLKLGPLPAGLYDAHLSMRLDGRPIATHQRRFAVIGAEEETTETGGPFGIALSSDDLQAPLISELLLRLHPSSIKVPVWNRATDDRDVVFGESLVRQLVKSAVDQGIRTVAVLAETPHALLPHLKITPRPDVLLAGDDDWVKRWEPYLNIITSRYGGYIDHWQLGEDGAVAQIQDKNAVVALKILRRYLRPLVGQPRLILPHDVLKSEGRAASLSDIQSVFIPAHLEPTLPAVDDPNSRKRPAWATLALADEDRYQRTARLSLFARRLIKARAARFERVFITSPWRYTEVDGVPLLQPREEAVIFHAINAAVRGQDMVERLTLDPNLETWLFTNADSASATIALWSKDESARTIDLDLPPGARMQDAWGRAIPLTTVNELAHVTTGPMPRLITGVNPAALRFQDSFEVDDPSITVAIEEHQRRLRLRNTYRDDIEGDLLLKAPRGWRITPRRVALRLRPDEVFETTLFIKPPTNETIGTKRLFGSIALNARGPSRVWTPLNVVAPGLDVSVFGHVEDGRVRFFQRVTNRTDRALDLRSFMIAPELPRRTRTIRGLGVGDTVVREYDYPSAEQLSGRPVRLSLEEIGGGLRHNEVVRVPYEPETVRNDKTGGKATRLDNSAAARALSSINGG